MERWPSVVRYRAGERLGNECLQAGRAVAKFARNRDGTSREIGVPWNCERALSERCRVLVETVVPTAVLEGLMVTGPVPRKTDFEDPGGPFFLDAECTRPDPLPDDQAIFFESREGLVVLLTLRVTFGLADASG